MSSFSSRHKQAVGGRPPQYAAAPLLPLWAPKCLAPPSRPRLQSADRNVAVGSHGQYVLTLTAAAAVSKAAWWPRPLTFWPWKWCPSHLWRGLPLCQFWSSYASHGVHGTMYATDRRLQTDKRQKHHRLMPPTIEGGA